MYVYLCAIQSLLRLIAASQLRSEFKRAQTHKTLWSSRWWSWEQQSCTRSPWIGGSLCSGRRWISSHRCVLTDSSGSLRTSWRLVIERTASSSSPSIFSFIVKATPFTLAPNRDLTLRRDTEFSWVCHRESMTFSGSKTVYHHAINNSQIVLCKQFSFECEHKVLCSSLLVHYSRHISSIALWYFSLLLFADFIKFSKRNLRISSRFKIFSSFFSQFSTENTSTNEVESVFVDGIKQQFSLSWSDFVIKSVIDNLWFKLEFGMEFYFNLQLYM